jgi:hypothetical protein
MSGAWRYFHSVTANAENQSSQSARRLSAIRQAIATSTSTNEIQAKLKLLLGKPKRTRKSAEGEEAKSGSWWTEATKRASAVLKELREAENERLVAKSKKKLPGTCTASVLKSMKDAGKLSKELVPTDADLRKAFGTWVKESFVEEDASEASAGTKGTTKSKFSELSPEEQKAKRSEAAKKAAATRAANKAKAAGGAPADDDEEEDD